MNNLIFYKTTADFDNTGEVLIYSSLLNFLRKYGHVVVDDGPKNDPLFMERIGIKDVEKLSTLSKLSFIPYMIKCSLLSPFYRRQIWFVTGVGEHDISGMRYVAKNLLAFCFLVFLRCCGVRVLRIGMSIRFGGRVEMLSEKLLSTMVNYYYVRDSISQTNCQQAGIKKCLLAPDLSWGRIFNSFTKPLNERTTVVLNFRDFCESSVDKRTYKDKLTERISDIIKWCIDDNRCQKILITHQCNADYDYMREIYSLCNHDKVQLLSELITLDNASDYYGQATMIVSNRLHVVLLGYKFGAPTICLSDIEKHRKIKGILMDNHLESALLDINTSQSDLIQNIKRIIDKKAEIELAYKNAESANYQKLSAIFESVFTES